MKTIFAEDAEKYSQLICEARLKTDEINSIEGMLKSPETISVVNFAFADNQSKVSHGGFCYGPQIVIEDEVERIECLTFFASMLKKQLEKINQQITVIEKGTTVNMDQVIVDKLNSCLKEGEELITLDKYRAYIKNLNQ